MAHLYLQVNPHTCEWAFRHAYKKVKYASSWCAYVHLGVDKSNCQVFSFYYVIYLVYVMTFYCN